MKACAFFHSFGFHLYKLGKDGILIENTFHIMDGFHLYSEQLAINKVTSFDLFI